MLLKYLILLLGVFTINIQHGSCTLETAETAVIDSNFVHVLSRGNYFNGSEPVRFLSSALNYPDLPSWLSLSQEDWTQDALLYGVPHSQMDSVEIEVIAMNPATHEFDYTTFKIDVVPSEAEQLYVAELWITNVNVGELLSSKFSKSLLRKVRGVWTTANDLHLVKVEPLAEVTGEPPIPADIGDDIKEGVLVQIGSSSQFSYNLTAVYSLSRLTSCGEGDDPADLAAIDKEFKPRFVIDWCKFRLISPADMPAQPTSSQQPPQATSLDSGWQPRTEYVERRDFSIDFIVSVVLPLALGLLLFLLLSYIMFGRREGVAKRNQKTPERQLMQFDSIRRATTNLRYMSQRRDGLPPASPQFTSTPLGSPTPGGRADPTRSEGSTAGTLPRTQAPPPYRLPPGYNPHADTMGSRRSQLSERDSSFGGQYEEDRSGEEQKLVDSSRETLPVRGQ